MINRALMQRQLRNRGGIMTVKTIRKKYGIGSTFQDFKDKALGKVRDIIPNELADVAVKAAPFVAPFYPGYAAAMRGIGRFDQRGSISDALKQGAATYAGGRGVRYLGGAEGASGGLDSYSMANFRSGPLGNFIPGGETNTTGDVLNRKMPGDPAANIYKGTVPTESTGIKKLAEKAVKSLPKGFIAQLTAGGITAGASLLASYFQGDFREQEPEETMEDYLAARKEAVGGQMRTFMDNYFKFDKDYSTMNDEQRNAFVARYNVRDGGRIGFANGGDIERFKKALYAANQVDEATGDRLYGNQINSLYAQYQNNPSGFFSEPEMYTRFNASFNAPATREEDEDLLSLTGDGLLNQAAIARSQQAKANEDALNMLNESMAPTTQTPTTSTPSVVDISSAAATRPEDVDTTTLEEIMSEPLDAVPTNNPFQDTLGAPISEQRTPGINMSNTLRQNLLNNMEQRSANQRVLQAARAKLPGAGIMNAPANIMPPMPSQMNESGNVFTQGGYANQDEAIADLGLERYNQLFNSGGRVGFSEGKTEKLIAAEKLAKEEGISVAEALKRIFIEANKEGVITIKIDEEFVMPKDKPKKAKGGRIGYAEGTEEPLEPINIGIGTFNPQRVLELYEKAKNIPKNISSKNISLEDIKSIPKRLMEGTKSSISSMVEPLGNEYRAYKKFFSLPKKDKKKMEEMGLGIFDVFEYLAMRDNKAKGGLMGIPVRKNSEGTTELDYRKSGGFVPIGVKEKADDVPAMLSKNEFVMTADAVRAAGGGSIEKGAQKMYDTMKKLESRVA